MPPRAVAMVWTSIGLLVAVLFGFAATQAFWEGVLSGERETIGLDLVLLLASWAALSFLTMRFRRLYVLQAPVNDPAEVQVRRRRFSVAASGAIGLLLVVALGSAAVKVAAERRAALRAQADAAVAAEEEQRVNEQRRAWQQQMEEEAAAERQRRLPFVPVPNDLPPPISPGPRVGGPGPARLRSGAANL
jgi:cytochrome bd-type quinol oxidase subunit 2